MTAEKLQQLQKLTRKELELLPSDQFEDLTSEEKMLLREDPAVRRGREFWQAYYDNHDRRKLKEAEHREIAEKRRNRRDKMELAQQQRMPSKVTVKSIETGEVLRVESALRGSELGRVRNVSAQAVSPRGDQEGTQIRRTPKAPRGSSWGMTPTRREREKYHGERLKELRLAQKTEFD